MPVGRGSVPPSAGPGVRSRRVRGRPTRDKTASGRPAAELPDGGARPVVLFSVVLHLPRKWRSELRR